MMDLIQALGRYAWRIYTEDGVSASGFNEPDQEDIFRFIDALAAVLTQLNTLATSGVQWKNPAVRAASIEPVTLSSIVNGASFGGVTVATGDFIAPMGQAAGATNGRYVVQASAPPVRASDADTADEVRGMAFYINEGTLAGWQYTNTNKGDIVLGTTPLTFAPLSNQSALNAALTGKADKSFVDALAALVDVLGINVSQKQDHLAGFSALVEWAIYNKTDGGIAIGKFIDAIAPYLGPGVAPLALMSFSAEWFWAVYGQATGAIYFGMRADGTFYPESSSGGGGGPGGVSDPGMSVAVVGTAPNRSIEVTVDGTAVQVSKGGDNSGAVLTGRDIAWTNTDDSGTRMLRGRMETATLFEQGRMVCVFGDGQSNGAGRTNGTVADGSEVAPGKVFMPATGIRVHGMEHRPWLYNKLLDRRRVDPLRPAREIASGMGGSTGFAVMGKRIAGAGGLFVADSDAVIVATMAIGGASYNSIKKGTIPYTSKLEYVRELKKIADMLGKTLVVTHVPYIAGEADRADDMSTFMGKLVEHQANLTTDFRAITGQTEEVVFVLPQMSSWTGGTPDGIAMSEVPLAQLQVAIDHPTKFRCSGPTYQFPYVDHLHRSPIGHDDVGDQIGIAINTASWLPLYPLSASAAGSVITVPFHVPVGSLALDTTLVSNPGNYGVEFFQTGGSPVTVTGVAVASSDTMEVTLSGTPDGTNKQIGFGLTGTPNTSAGPTTGPRTCIRDSSAIVSARGTTLRNYCAHSRVPVTT